MTNVNTTKAIQVETAIMIFESEFVLEECFLPVERIVVVGGTNVVVIDVNIVDFDVGITSSVVGGGNDAFIKTTNIMMN